MSTRRPLVLRLRCRPNQRPSSVQNRWVPVAGAVVCLAETDKRKVQKRHACLQTRNIVLGRYPTGSGARTVVACEPPTRAAEWETARAASPREPPPSPPRGAPPVRPLAFRAAI